MVTAEGGDDTRVDAAIGASPAVLGLRMGLACLLVFAVLLALVFDFAYSTMRRAATSDMLQLAGLVASQVDADAHRRLIDGTAANATHYDALLAPLARTERALPKVRRIYTVVYRDGTLWHALDTNRTTRGGAVLQRVPVENAHLAHMLEAVRSGQPLLDDAPHHDAGEPLRGVLVPLRGVGGGDVEMLGMDVAESEFRHQSGGWVAGVYAGVVGGLILLAVLLGLFLYLQRRLLGEVLRQLREESVNDGLTGLLNRRSFGQRLEQALAHARRTDLPLALLLIDIDHFKRVNDSHGHAAGDAVIVAVARRLREFTRGDNPVCRIGGEEYAVILPRADADDALAVYQRLDAALREPVAVGTLALDVSVSGGIAWRLPGDDRVEQLFQRADAALYRAKQEGRRRCMLAEDGSAP